MMIGLLFGLFKVDAAQLEQQSLQRPLSYKALPRINAQLNDHVKVLNELSERRQTRTLFNNEQSVFYGLRKHFVNVGKGNLSFIRRDLVTVGRIPLTIARVYDSSLIDATTAFDMAGDFGANVGWRLSLAETVSVSADGILLYRNGSATLNEFRPTATGYKIHPAQNGDIKAVDFNSQGLLQVTYLNGWTKVFQKLAGIYRLTIIKDNNTNQINLLYTDHLLVSVIGDNNRRVDIYRDDIGRITRVTDDQNRTVSYSYNQQGQLAVVFDLAGHPWRYKYHDNQRLHKVVDPLNQLAAKFRYNKQGKAKVIKIRDKKFTYQYAGNKTIVRDGNGNISTFIQNDIGITTAVTNAEGFTSSIVLNDRNQITRLWHNEQLQAQITYDGNGRPSQFDINPKPTALEKLKAGQYQQYRYQYDSAGRIIAIDDNDDRHIRYSYDEKGNLTQRKNNDGSFTYRYAVNGDVIGETSHATGQPEQAQTFDYNGDGLLTTLTEQQQTTRFSYGGVGKLNKITFVDGAVHHYSYDKLGFRIQTNRSDKSSVSYVYDSLGNLKSSTNIDTNKRSESQPLILDQNNQLTKVKISDQTPLTIKYSAKGNPKTISHGNRVSQYHYDKLGRLINVEDTVNGLSHYDYQHGEADIRLQLDDRTRPVQSLQSKISSHNQVQSNFLYARIHGSPWQAVVWNEAMSKLLLPSPQILNSPDAGYQSGKQRRRLYNAMAVSRAEQYDFDKASNSFFLPPEYQSANCYYGCSISIWSLFVPSTAKVGESLTFFPVISKNQCLMFYYLNTEGASSVLSTDGIFSHIYQTPGLKKVTVTAACQLCPWIGNKLVKYVDVVKPPPCNVEFSLTSPTAFKISATPTMPTITAAVTKLSPANAQVSWTAKINHNAPINAAFCSGNTNANSPEVTGTGMSFTPTWGTDIYGGDLIVTATCRAPGYTAASKSITDKAITGREPLLTQYDTRLSGGLNAPLNRQDLRRIACKESHLKHFDSSGKPNYSGTGRGDVGVMQICFQRQTEHIWNYLDNISWARTILNQKINSARNSLNAQLNEFGATQWTQAMLREETIHRYNAGNLSTSDRYWDWNINSRRWEVVDVGGIGGYYTAVNQKPANCTN